MKRHITGSFPHKYMDLRSFAALRMTGASDRSIISYDTIRWVIRAIENQFHTSHKCGILSGHPQAGHPREGPPCSPCPQAIPWHFSIMLLRLESVAAVGSHTF